MKFQTTELSYPDKIFATDNIRPCLFLTINKMWKFFGGSQVELQNHFQFYWVTTEQTVHFIT